MEGWPGYTLERDGEGVTEVRHRAEGHRPYRTDLGLLSKGRGYGSNLGG